MQESLQPNHFDHLFGGVVLEEALKKAQGWNLKSRVCHPLDRPARLRSNTDLDRFDASIDAESAAEE